jgi:speckle-type POZ protein
MPAPGSAAADVDVPRSASAIVAGTLTGHHLLHIEGYSRIKDDTPNGKCIKSCPFRVGGSSWSIWYYPNGQSSEDTDFIDIFIFLVESATGPVKARIKFSLMDQDDEPVPSHTVSAVLYEFAVQGKAAGLHKFIAKEFLEASEHLKDDCFKILCDITIPGELRKEERVTASPFVVVPPSDMHKHLGDFLKAKDGVDVTFQVGGKTFRAHRHILTARSPVFKAELLGAMREGTTMGNCIHIDDLLPEVFEILLHFVYNDSLPEMEVQEVVVMAQHLLEAADRYDMTRLKLICEEKLCNYLEVSMVAATMVLAEQHNCQGLKDACIEFLKSPGIQEDVMETDGFDHLTKTSPALVKELMSKLATPGYKRRKLET